ncbi:GNAT family N-acetyltransferase [Delftia lacustris]|uniref:GNAT family N-acetyltransferase n=2 Tax=Comamonadaceae TaxID=80864 RepID=A0A7T2YSV1_9BURK|nr:GNAT family N-acetyltransferase [Delftia lacustris]
MNHMLVYFRNLSLDAICRQMDELISISEDVSPWGRAEFLQDLPEKWFLSFTAHMDGMVGYCILSHKFPGRCHIHQFMVRPDMRGMNVGRDMLLEAVRRTMYGRLLSLKVHRENIGAQRFYIKNGFQVEKDDGDYHWMYHRSE